MKLTTRLFLLCVVLLTTNVIAQDQAPADTEGCKDSPLITRMPGSTIHSCDNKE